VHELSENGFLHAGLSSVGRIFERKTGFYFS
jgi:hypothetical protein